MLHSEPRWRVGEPSFVTYRREPPASRTARFGTTCRSKPGRSPTIPPIAARHFLEFGLQAERAALLTWRREGSKPNGRVGIAGTGASPRTWRGLPRHEKMLCSLKVEGLMQALDHVSRVRP